ncbi:hypothetical protein D0C16_01185 [Cellvibrio sp. KY-GH-1]|uniref:hypothetical protein n=1 Tax=Cellvibrio sp. KY-GH-1 TaxID=2303332 RepID=UPI0012448A53|nr:hypothetical protein [Cellvibrio sp. KY-GH-1]QEY14707.1 hypothetical protein D0C16_01185 [Cellvibrio sp. KY-GH-1]
MPERRQIFLLGILIGLISMFMLWVILFTTVSGPTKLGVFGLCAFIAFGIQVFALRKLKRPQFWQRYNLAAFHQEVRNYKWFGIFLFGVASPYMLSLIIYVFLKNL